MALSSVEIDSDDVSVSDAPAHRLVGLFDGYVDGPFRGPFTLVRDNGGSDGRHLAVRGREDTRMYTIVGSDLFNDEANPETITGWEVELFADSEEDEDDEVEDSVQATKIVNRLLENENQWDDPKNWLSKKDAAPFVQEDILDAVPLDAKICIIPGDEIADCILYNDFRGGIHVWINGGWKRFNDEETAFNSFLETDHWAS